MTTDDGQRSLLNALPAATSSAPDAGEVRSYNGGPAWKLMLLIAALVAVGLVVLYIWLALRHSLISGHH